MQEHTRIYLEAHDYTDTDFIECELDSCGKPAVDIHHIEARGMGGDPNGDKDVPENLMALCRHHHELYGDKKKWMDYLRKQHRLFTLRRKEEASKWK